MSERKLSRSNANDDPANDHDLRNVAEAEAVRHAVTRPDAGDGIARHRLLPIGTADADSFGVPRILWLRLMSRYVLISLVCVSMLLATLRLLGWHSPAFQAFAHLFVGGLIALAITRRGWAAWAMAGGLSAVELFAFFTQ